MPDRAPRLGRQHLQQMVDVGRAKGRQTAAELALVLALDQRIHQLGLVGTLPLRQGANQVVPPQKAQDRLEASVQVGPSTFSQVGSPAAGRNQVGGGRSTRQATS